MLISDIVQELDPVRGIVNAIAATTQSGLNRLSKQRITFTHTCTLHCEILRVAFVFSCLRVG